jgi:YbgC/YbaW family acyl-CoA thioester hydrolase
VFRYQRRVQFAETDAAGMVHFSQFFRYMEEAEHAAWRAAGMSIHVADAQLKWPRVSANFAFKTPLRFEDEFEVRVTMAAASARTIQWAHEIVRGTEQIGTGSVTAACVGRDVNGVMKAVEIPAEVFERLRAVLQAP